MTEALTRGRLARGGILRGGVAAGGILRSQRQGSPYAFNLDLSTFKDTVTGQSLSCNIDGTRYDEVDGVTTAFATDVPTIADKGLRICGAYSNLILYSEDLSYSVYPTWQKQVGCSVENVENGIYRVNMISDLDGIITRTSATYPLNTIILISAQLKTEGTSGLLRFQEASGYSTIPDVNNVTVSNSWQTFTFSGVLTSSTERLFGLYFRKLSTGISSFLIRKTMCSIGSTYLKPYVPTTNASVSSHSEAGNSDTGTGIWIDDVATKFPLLYSALQSAGTMTLKWKPGYSSADVTGNLNILSFNGTTTSAISYDANNNLIKITDGTNTASKALTVVADTEYTIQTTWGLVSGSPKMQIAVNGTAGTQETFAGTFNPSNVYFGLNNEELQYISEFKVYKQSLYLNTTLYVANSYVVDGYI